MSNRCFRIIWLRLHTESGKSFHLNFPISLNVFLELLDNADDVITLICLFVPKMAKSRITVYSIKELVQMLMELLGSITDYGPYDLVNVDAHNVKVSIRVR